MNINDKIICANYGIATAIALDPIEKKPLAMYKSGSKILSIGSFGCNFRCPFCQNHNISMANADSARGNTMHTTPEDIVSKAEQLLGAGNIGIAFTYNEPLIGYEFVQDTARLAKEHALDTVVVTNGCISSNYFSNLLLSIDAMNIDLKAFNDSFYTKIKGSLATVKTNIALAVEHCHVELTCLIIPHENDSIQEMESMCNFISSVSPDIPLHLTRSFPQYLYANKQPTPHETLFALKAIAQKKLKQVFVGNV
jgi:pyruvate formate lyase activating enzyme